jgi:hypothetical protein
MSADLHAEWMVRMQRGDYVGAWEINALVLAGREAAARDDQRLPYHLRWVWDGRPFDGQHVLVRCYHGLGDTLQFARYLPELRRRVVSLTLETQAALIPLLAGLRIVDHIIPFDIAAPAPPAECDLEIMELPFALRMPPEGVSPPYLQSPAAILPHGTVGLCWAAGGWDPARSVPADLFRLFTSRPCVTLLPAPTTLDVLNSGGCPMDLAATAALISGCTLVVTVDTMVAHLAGALNRPTWLLLKQDADWRWLTNRVDSPWYPAMRLYRQCAPGVWDAVFDRLSRDWTAVGLGDGADNAGPMKSDDFVAGRRPK